MDAFLASAARAGVDADAAHGMLRLCEQRQTGSEAACRAALKGSDLLQARSARSLLSMARACHAARRARVSPPSPKPTAKPAGDEQQIGRLHAKGNDIVYNTREEGDNGNVLVLKTVYVRADRYNEWLRNKSHSSFKKMKSGVVKDAPDSGKQKILPLENVLNTLDDLVAGLDRTYVGAPNVKELRNIFLSELIVLEKWYNSLSSVADENHMARIKNGIQEIEAVRRKIEQRLNKLETEVQKIARSGRGGSQSDKCKNTRDAIKAARSAMRQATRNVSMIDRTNDPEGYKKAVEQAKNVGAQSLKELAKADTCPELSESEKNSVRALINSIKKRIDVWRSSPKRGARNRSGRTAKSKAPLAASGKKNARPAEASYTSISDSDSDYETSEEGEMDETIGGYDSKAVLPAFTLSQLAEHAENEARAARFGLDPNVLHATTAARRKKSPLSRLGAMIDNASPGELAAFVNKADATGTTPLHLMAASSDYGELTQRLASAAGAEIMWDFHAGNDFSAIDTARRSGNQRFLDIASSYANTGK